MEKNLIAIVAIMCASYHLSAADFRRDTYASYLKSISYDVPERERTFDPGNGQYLSEQILRLGLQARKHQNIVVLYDTSGSTMLQQGSSSALTPAIANQKISVAYGNNAIPKEHLQEYLSKELGVHSRFCPAFLSSAYIAEALKSLQEGRSLPVDSNGGAQMSEVAPVKTKHISLAQAEGLARIFQILSRTDSDDTDLFLLAFSSSVQEPVGIKLPHRIKKANEFAEIAQNLSSILPKPDFGGTSLAPALRRVISQLRQSPLADTLLIVITDGQTDDAAATGALLAECSKDLEAAGKKLDIFAVGSGSIFTTHVVPVASHIGFEEYSSRSSKFSHVSGAHANFSGAECNMGYLQSLTNFKTLFGRGAYEGVFLDYSALETKFIDFLTGEKDTSNALYIQGDNGKWWAAKSHQYLISEASLCSEEKIIKYDRNDVVVTISKLDDLALSKNIIKVTDTKGVSRFYLCAPKNLLEFNPQTGALGSSSQNIQDAIDFVSRNNINSKK